MRVGGSEADAERLPQLLSTIYIETLTELFSRHTLVWRVDLPCLCLPCEGIIDRSPRYSTFMWVLDVPPLILKLAQ